MSHQRKIILVNSLLGIFAAGFLFGIFVVNGISKKIGGKSQMANSYNALKKDDPRETRLYFVGDIMLDRGVENSVSKNFNGDFSRLFENLDELKNADILFGNLEGDVSSKGNDIGNLYSFRMKPSILSVLKDAGFNIVSFANNHVDDWGIDAFKDTLSNLDINGIKKVGAGMNYQEATTPVIIEKNGTKFGFIGFSDVGPNWVKAKEDSPGILLASDPNLPQIVSGAKAQCDVLIVSFHWGTEYKDIHNERQQTLAHEAIDNGADMVIGHHPHVIEDIEVYKDKPIIYSLGNFIFDQPFSNDTMEGMLFETTFLGSMLEDTQQRLIKLNKYFQPVGICDISERSTKDLPQKTTQLAKKVEKVACPTPTKDYEDESMFNVSQMNSLPDTNYTPSNLVLLDSSISPSNVCLKKEVADSLAIMINDAKKSDVNIKVSSGFRNYDIQENMFLKQQLASVGSASLVAKPGYSEHQLGTAVDLASRLSTYDEKTQKYQDVTNVDWLENNAYKYGFIESYPKGKELTTGYIYEPWHYRYVGVENAQKIHDSGLAISEFLK